MLVVTSSIRTWVLLTASAVTARPHGLHSNVSSDNSAWNAVRASCIVSPQHGQATYSYSRIFDCPRTHARQRRVLYAKFSQFGGDIVGECLANDRPGRREAVLRHLAEQHPNFGRGAGFPRYSLSSVRA